MSSLTNDLSFVVLWSFVAEAHMFVLENSYGR
jgi:hypothetical protein